MKDISGMKFGRLSVIRFLRNDKNWKPIWECRCDCGTIRECLGERLKCGNTKSCGCLIKETVIERSTKHGHAKRHTKSTTYKTWRSIIERCTNPNNKAYPKYGAKGIRICKRWLTFENFLADMGERPAGRTIDRIKNNGHYLRSNCRWATLKEQALNRRSTRFMTLHGEVLCIKDWAKKYKVAYSSLLKKLSEGMTLEESLGVLAR